jgi:hypothetical protein
MFMLQLSLAGMAKQLNLSIVMAVLLAGAGTFYQFAALRPGIDPNPDSAQRRRAVEECHTAARMVFDVHWAAACMSQAGQGPGQADGHAECELPDAKAAIVNKWLDEAEAQCMAEVRASLGP